MAEGGVSLPTHSYVSHSCQWLTLREASEFLGVHFTTLRIWADNGVVPVFRTPGGHRRFNSTDLRRFLDERFTQSEAKDPRALVDIAVGRVREEIGKIPHQEAAWLSNLDHGTRQLQRQRGRELFALAIAYVLKPGQRDRILADGRRLGRQYGLEAALSEISLAETGRAVQFFRNRLTEALSTGQRSAQDAEDGRIQRLVSYFLDEVLYAVLDGYEEARTSSNVG